LVDIVLVGVCFFGGGNEVSLGCGWHLVSWCTSGVVGCDRCGVGFVGGVGVVGLWGGCLVVVVLCFVGLFVVWGLFGVVGVFVCVFFCVLRGTSWWVVGVWLEVWRPH